MYVARTITECLRAGRFRLAGADIMKFNVHFLGIETRGGIRDETLQVAHDFLAELLVGQPGEG
jgi:hypothetical protein